MKYVAHSFARLILIATGNQSGAQALPFTPGISGNPSGRPKVTLADGRTLADLAREHTETAISVLAEIAANKAESASARVSAATALLDRGWGRPKQAIVGDASEDPIQVMRRLGSTPAHLLTPEESTHVMDFFFGKEFVQQTLAEPRGYIEHQ